MRISFLLSFSPTSCEHTEQRAKCRLYYVIVVVVTTANASIFAEISHRCCIYMSICTSYTYFCGKWSNHTYMYVWGAHAQICSSTCSHLANRTIHNVRMYLCWYSCILSSCWFSLQLAAVRLGSAEKWMSWKDTITLMIVYRCGCNHIRGSGNVAIVCFHVQWSQSMCACVWCDAPNAWYNICIGKILFIHRHQVVFLWFLVGGWWCSVHPDNIIALGLDT